MGYIYLVVNKINSKKYIGQTTRTIQKRWEDHIYNALNNHDDFYFHRAIKKYGVENFNITELISCPDNQLDEQEIYYIEKYHTYYLYNEGYNLTRGGKGSTKVNREEILKQWNEGKSAAEISQYFGFYIRTITDVLKQEGVLQTEIYSRSMKYGARFRYKRIFQYNFSGELINIYNNLNEMAELTGYRKDYISAACRHVYTSANGYLWIYEDEEETIENLLKQIPEETRISILQYDENGEFIKEFSSYRSAAKELHCDVNLIINAVKQISATAKGYFWKAKNDPIDINAKIQAYNNRYNDRKKKIVQMDKDNNIIATYNSITEAANAIGKPSIRSAISKVCQGKQATSGGYKWAYAEA